MEQLSEAHEDFLKAIVMLGGTPEAPVRQVDVARRLGITKPSVNKAMNILREDGYLTQSYYGKITLTQKGYEYGLSVYERHELLANFLSKAVGIPRDRAEEEACRMEHAISDESFEKWREYIEKLGL